MDIGADLLATDEAGAERVGTERADAARNRAKILAAAATVFSSRDPRSVTMDHIATAAGVGRGTLYRRYPSTAAIALALLDEHERALQERLISGDPPLGPGAAPADRLAAFYSAMVDLLETHTDLALGAETGGARFTTGAYGFWAVHVRALLTEAGVSEPDSLVDALLAPLAAENFAHQRARGLSVRQISGALTRLAHAMLAENRRGQV
ncbi:MULTISPECIES: TetR/AcrR family transcriptional regulator [unclassified Mycolicibacterium]|uniref:TetR/AcrR family transcriptional regulator n=1 Tax=unclassified Mycolicibacterium TaxID=2636767 RepID=UPI0012DD515F|nr:MULTISPECIES: TetR/AcrR family transcriptional regulator [unclassified Mycolicibacterium]MUL84405.1 TetR/AcrR family transcriptional regulator [Mycolicibacterium sp. CBMA 329]MUL88180.1 TetR/AcrR family transcriptional regulator [Mycolicibacterium sp. CBMA 331]MUL99371.1 TetR/AcrR family transcriptional regulator [Mycolicibacterium sp. CBMA 334]MUM25978.1 TetR/AcrR family transcriptional regulator [Mycolicibacterium sp. CBMA 295]MUM39827.1 TetR/AcrR family transcriptional regulator [Mycolic